MNKKMLVSSSMRMMWRYKLRTGLGSIGIILGVATLLVMRSYGDGARASTMEHIERFFGTTGIFLMAGGGFGSQQKGPMTTLTLEDLSAISQALPGIVEWDATQDMSGLNARYKGQDRSVLVRGHSERAESVWGRTVTRSSFFDQADINTSARVALLGPKVARFLFGDNDPIGAQIQIGGAPYRVKGILEAQGIDPHGIDRDDEIQVPISTLMRRLKNVDYITTSKLIVADSNQLEQIAEGIAEILRQRHALAAGEPDDFTVITPSLVREMVANSKRVFRVFLPAVASIALLVAAIVIANIMLMSVKERIPEIGLRKALGATDAQISRQFLMEAFTLTLISGLAGIGLGLTVIMLVKMHGPQMVIEPAAIVLGLLASMAVGILAGLLPARKAAKMDPVAALR